jgi:hypothetical protein
VFDIAKAYKCDVCKDYCDDIYKIEGLSEPETHVVGRFGAFGLECCTKCYDKICNFVSKEIKT